MSQNTNQIHTCAKCGTQTEERLAIVNEYKCPDCDYELAHLDVAANGAVRGVFGWLKEIQAVIGERYIVETVLGKGGFGATYLVSDNRVQGKRWALKEIPEMLFDEYEVSLLSQLDHPSIPIIVDRFTDEGMVYLVLKFGGTKTLATECKQQQKLAYDTLKPWVLQIADVLQYLHSRTPPIIHRDLKPENILIDDQNRVMLIDFGIAKESVAAAVTRTLGRAASMGFSPPEQVMGTGTDVRSDIYSFAATVYFALVGETPIAAHERVAGKVLHPPSELGVKIPAEANAMLMKALNLNINERPQTITEFIAAFTGATNANNEALDSNKTVQISNIQFGPVINDGTRSTPLGSQNQAEQKKSKLIPIIAGLIVVTALSASGYWFMQQEDNNTSNNSLSSEKTPIKTETLTTQPIATPTTSNPDVSNTTTTAPTSIPSTAVTPTQLQKNENTPSALDILNKRREGQRSKEADFVDNTKPAPSAEDKLKAERDAKAAELAAIEKARKIQAAKEAKAAEKARLAALAEKERKRKAAAAAKARAAEKARQAAAARARKTPPPAPKPNWGNQQQGSF